MTGRSDVFVDGLGYALGATKYSVEESVAADRTVSTAAALLDAGFRFHHVCADDESAYDLARAAVDAMPGGPDALDGLDAIIYATCIPQNANVGTGDFIRSRDVKDLMDFPASRLQAALGQRDAIVVGLNQQACTGMLGSLRLARALIRSEGFGKVLCLTADRFPPGARYEQAYNLISDGAGACLVTERPARFRLLGVHHVTNGAMVQADDDETVGSFFSYMHKAVSATLQRGGLTMADIDWVVPQNTNAKAWQILARLLKVDRDRVFAPTLPDAGHIISADNIVNLAAFDASGVGRPGDRILLTMAGYGMNWQCAVLEVA
jgi:3-oxoacyl-[acyl-carrier-protein] synthase-3